MPPFDESVLSEVKSKQSNSEEKSFIDYMSWLPYFTEGCNFFKEIQIPNPVKDLILWTEPRTTKMVFFSSLMSLLSLASFSLLTVISFVFLFGMSIIGLYRIYLGIIFRIKGTEDKTFEKLLLVEVSLPKNKIQEFTQYLENDLSTFLNQIKSILIWDNVFTSSLWCLIFYVMYCIGCIFNLLTLMILTLVSVFTLPKVYQVYGSQIDKGFEKGVVIAHTLIKQLMTKVPFLNKQKIL
jgi:hypothetical protein